jgi:hypothetical protein
MAKSVKKLAKLLGAEIIGRVPDAGGGAFGAARLAHIMAVRLEPGEGDRPGRPTVSTWTRRPKVPMSEATEKKLMRLAKKASGGKRKVSPMQVAAQVLEEALAAYPDE